MDAGVPFGMMTFDRHIIGLYEQGLITQETALAYASHRGIVGRGIDMVKSSRGEATTDIDNLEIDLNYEKSY
jgi:twitching motility protein PilT